MRGKWKRLLVVLLVVSMLVTDSSLSEVIYAAGQSLQQENALLSEEDSPSKKDDVSTDDADKAGPDETNAGAEDTDTGSPAADDTSTDEAGVDNTNADGAGTDSTDVNGAGAGTDGVNADGTDAEEPEVFEDIHTDLSIINMDEVISADEPLTVTQQAILAEAEKAYGGESAQALVSYFYVLDKKDSYQAGQELTLAVMQKLHSSAMFNYNSGAQPLAKQLRNMQVTVTLPEGLTCTRCDLKEAETYLKSCAIEENGKKLTLTYNESCPIPGNDVNSQFFIYVRIDGNGAKQDGETVTLNTDDVDIQTEFSASLPVLDLSGGGEKVIGEIQIPNCLSVDESEFPKSVTVNSADRWGTIVSTDTHEENGGKNWYYDEDGNIVMTWTVAAALENPKTSGNPDEKPYEKLYLADAKLLRALTGEEEEVAQLQAKYNLTMYAAAGRAPLSEFALLSKVYAEKGGEKIYPDSLTLELLKEDGQTVRYDSEDKLKTEAPSGSAADGVTLENYATAGGYIAATGKNDTGMDGNTPWYSTYKVTAVFPKEKFITHFYDKDELYTFTNEVTLTSKVSSVNEKEVIWGSRAEGGYQDATVAYPVDLAQSIAMGLGVDFLYTEENLDGILAPFTGESTYTLWKKNGDKWEPYRFYTNKNSEQGDTDYLSEFTIASPTDGKPLGQHLGETTIYVEEGTYRLQKDSTTMGSDVAELLGCSGTGSSADAAADYEFTVGGPLSEEHQKLYVHYKAKGERILFRLADKEDESKMLPGAEYALYENGTEVGTAVSTAQGSVVFAALKKNTKYTVKQIKAPEGYILDETVYTVDTGDTADGGADEYGAHYPKNGAVYYPALENENNHYPGQAIITKYISTFAEDKYTDAQADIENNATGTFNADTFRVEDNSSGDWAKTTAARVKIEDGKLCIRNMEKYCLDVSGAVKRGTDGEPLPVHYRVVETLPDGYSNSAKNQGAAVSKKDGSRLVTYPDFDVESAFGYGTEDVKTSAEYKYYNEVTTQVTLTQKLYDGESSRLNTADGGRSWKLFYQVGTDELKEYEESGALATDESGRLELAGLPVALKDSQGAYKQVSWYFGQDGIGPDEQLEYKRGEGYSPAQVQKIDGTDYYLIPFDFSEDPVQTLSTYRLVMKAGIKVYKYDDNNNPIHGAEFKVTCGGDEIKQAAEGGSSSSSGIVFWVPMFEEYTIEETVAPNGYMKGDALPKDPILSEDDRSLVTPETYAIYTSLNREENHVIYTDSRYPLFQVEKWNYTYDGDEKKSIKEEVTEGKVKFELYKMTENADGSKTFTKADAVHNPAKPDTPVVPEYKSQLGNGETVEILPGTYYLAEVFDPADSALEGYINPEKIENIQWEMDGTPGQEVIRQAGRVYYPLGEFEKNDELRTCSVTNYHNCSGSLKIRVEDMLSERGFNGDEDGQVELTATAVGPDGQKVYTSTVQVSEGSAVFENMPIFDEEGNYLTYTVVQTTDHPGYSHSSESVTIDRLKIGETTQTQASLDGEYDFHEFPRLDVTVQVNWVKDLTYDQLSEAEKPSAQEKLPGALINVYEKKTDENGIEYYELIQTCRANENGVITAEGLEEFPEYVFVEAGYDTALHTDALNPESTGEKDFDRHRYDPANPVRLTQAELDANYDYLPYQYIKTNSSITEGTVVVVDMATEVIIEHELWMQLRLSKLRYYTARLDAERDGIYKITPRNDGTYDYKHYRSETFSYENQDGQVSETGNWSKDQLEKMLEKAEASKTQARVIYDKNKEPKSILFGSFQAGQNAMYNLYRVRLSELTEDEVSILADGQVSINIDFQNPGKWELVDDSMVTDEFGETISKEQIADDSYVYFLVETKEPYTSLGMGESSEVMGTSYVTVFHKSGAEYTYTDENGEHLVPLGDITYRCKTVNYNKKPNCTDWVDTSVRTYDINTDSDEELLNKGYIGKGDSNNTNCYGFVQFNKWKRNKAYDENDPNGEKELTPVSSAEFLLYHSRADGSKSIQVGRKYESIRTKYSSDAYVSTDIIYPGTYYLNHLNSILSEYAKVKGVGPKNLTELDTVYDQQTGSTEEKVAWLNNYVKSAMEECGGGYTTMFYVSNVITNLAENAGEILSASDARLDSYSRWGIRNDGRAGTAATLDNEQITNVEPAYFDLFDPAGENGKIAIGFAQQMAYDVCEKNVKTGDAISYVLTDGFPLDGNGVSADEEKNVFNTRRGVYRFIYMHCYIQETKAPAGTFLNTEHKNLLLQSGAYVHRAALNESWGSWWEASTTNCINTYAGKSNLNNANNYNRTWYYSDEKYINDLGDVEKQKYAEKGQVASVDYSRAQIKSQDADRKNIGRYLNKNTEAKTIKYTVLADKDTGYYSGKRYINDTQVGYTVKVQSLGYPSLLTTYGKTDNELQALYEANNLFIRNGILAGTYRLQKRDEVTGEYRDFVYPRTHEEDYGHFREEDEPQSLCEFNTYEKNTDPEESGIEGEWKASVFTFPQGLGLGVYRLVPCAEGGSKGLISEYQLNDRYYDTYAENEAYRYFRVARTSADQYVDVFYPELPNILAIKQENSPNGSPYRTGKSLKFTLKGTEALTREETKNGNTADFRLLKEGTYTLEEELTEASGSLTDIYYKEDTGIKVEVIDIGEGAACNKKKQKIEGLDAEVDAPVFNGYRITALEGRSVAVPDEQVTADSRDATATISTEMATTFNVYMSNPQTQNFRVKKIDALTKKGLQNAGFKVYFRPFDSNTIVTDTKTSNNKVILTQNPSAPKLDAAGELAGGSIWKLDGYYVSNSNGFLMKEDASAPGITGAPGWYYVVETDPPQGKSYDIAQPLLFAYTGTLEFVDQSEGAVRTEDGSEQIVVEDSDKIRLTVDKFFFGSSLTGQHKLESYELRLYKDAACTDKATIYDYDEDGRYTKKSDSLLMKGQDAGAGPGGQDLRAGSVTVHVDYNESDAYYLKETMVAKSEEEAELWLAACSQLKSNVSFVRLAPVSTEVSGRKITVVWKLTDFAGRTVNQSHKVDARVWNVYGAASVKMFKTISTNTDYALTGAKFELSSGGEVLDTAVSGEEKWDGAERYNVEFEVDFGWDDIVSCSQESGKPEFTGKYFTVKEVEAPAGYQVSSTTWDGSVLPGQTVYLRKDGKDFIDSDGITLRLIKYDNVADAVGKNREEGQGFQLHVKESADGEWKEVGEVQYTDEDGIITFPAVSVGTADFRYRYALTYEGAENEETSTTCGLDEISIRFNGANYELHGETGGEKTYYVLNAEGADVIFAAGMTYLINAYDVPKSDLQVKKEILGGQQTSEVVYGLHKIRPEEDLSSKDNVIEAIRDYTEDDYVSSTAPRAVFRFTGLEAGRYLVWEISTEPITTGTGKPQEVVINLDHPQVVWYDIVEVDPSKYQGRKVYEAALKNRPSGVEPDLDKRVDKEEVPSLLDQEAELTYTITPALSHRETEAQRALTAVVLEDAGLSFYSDTKGEAEITEEASKPDYKFTTLTLAQPTYEDGSFGSFTADVTFRDKAGNESTEHYQLPLTGQDISEKNAVSFSVSYTDTTYQASRPRYAAGEGLIPGAVTVKAKVEKSRQFEELMETRKIKNMSSFSISYPDWKTTFKGSVEAKDKIITEHREAEAATDVLGVDVPVLAIAKTVNPTGVIPVDRNLGYTITVANMGAVPMENAVLVDQVPDGLSIDTSTDGWYLLEKVHPSTEGAEDTTVALGNEKVTAEIFTADGQEILIFRLTDTLAAGSYYRLTLVKDRCTVTSSALLNKDRKLLNRAYVTALEKSYKYGQNKSGNAFKDAIEHTDGLDNSAMNVAPGLEDALEAHFGKELCGVLEAEAENTVKPGEGFVTVKSEHGDLDGNNVWISDLNSASMVSQSDGTIEYRLSVTNAENDAKKGVVLFDIFPYMGDYTGSQWTLKADTTYNVTAKTTDENGTAAELTNGTDFKVTYGNLKGVSASNSAHVDYGKVVWEEGALDEDAYNAVRIEYLAPEGLLSNETLTVTVKAKLWTGNTGAAAEWIYKEAINRFGVFHMNDENKPDGKSSAYSNRVKAQLIPSNVGLSGKVWIDTNKSHTQDTGDIDVNSYTVVQALFGAIRLKLSGYRMTSSAVSTSAETEITKADDGLYTGTYQFTGLTPARPVDNQFKVLYTEDGTLDPYRLQGAAVSYSLELASEGQDEDLIKLVDKGEYASYSYGNENALVRDGYWAIEVKDGQTLGEKNTAGVMATDSNFRQTTGLNGVSDRFFLFSAKLGLAVNTVTNDAMDAGVQIDRQITVTKKDSLGNLLQGVEFEVYEYDLSDTGCTGTGTKVEGTFFTDENGQFTFTGNYFKNYRLVEKDINDQAYSGETAFTTSYNDIKKVSGENAWIIECIGEGDDYSRLREDLTITNKLAEGTIRFDKRKETSKDVFAEAEETDNFRFTLTYKETDTSNKTGVQAWKAYLERIANAQDLLVGCSYEGQSGQSMTVKVTGGTTTIKGLPMGTYELREETPQNYVAADPVTIILTDDGQIMQAYNKDTAESQNPVARAFRSMKRVVGSLFQTENTTTSVADTPADTKVLVNYQKRAEISLVKKGTDKTGEKTLAGAEFTLYKDESCTQALGTYSTEEAAGTSISFENLQKGENTFYLKETKSPGELWEISRTMWTIRVTVEAGKRPKITVDGTDANSEWTESNLTLTVKDKYLERSGNASITGSKQINGKSMAESALKDEAKNSFGFTLYEAEQNAGTMDYTVGGEVANASIRLEDDGSGSFSFENFAEYDETMHGDNFYYAICEKDIEDAYGGYLRKDETWYILAVHVENDPENTDKMKTTATVYRSAIAETTDGTTTVKNVSAAPDNKVVFDNTYITTSEDYSLKVGKSLSGREIKANEFKASLQKLYRAGSLLFPEGTAQEEAAFAVDAADAHHGTALFEKKLNAFTRQGFYYYQVTEEKPAAGSDGICKKDGVEYDASTCYLLFYVKDNGMGSMAPVLVGTYKNQTDCIAGEDAYKATLAGGPAAQTGLAAFFQSLFAAEPTVSPSADNVFDLTDGTAKVEFANKYTVAPARLAVTVGKKLDGRTIGGNEFKVQIAGKEQADKDVLTGVDSTVYISAQENSDKGTAEFQGLTFKTKGEYSFTLSEVKGDNPHVIYDEKTYTLTVTVEDIGDGQLYVTEATVLSDSAAAGTAPTPVYTKPAGENGMADGSLDLSQVQSGVPGSPADESGKVVFENTYTSAVELKLAGKKTVQNQDGDTIPFEKLTNKIFTIRLQQTDADYNLIAGGTAKEVKTDPADGSYAFEELTYDQTSLRTGTEGSYKYKTSADFYYLVTEEAAGTGYDANTQEYRLHVILTKEANGDLSLQVMEDKAEGEAERTLTLVSDSGKTPVYTLSGQDFINVYRAEGRLELKGKKKLTGLNLEDDLFDFVIRDADDADKEIVSSGTNKNGNAGEITFTSIAYDETAIGRTFTYTVEESWNDTLTNSGYSQVGDNLHKLTVRVEDGGAGKLKLTATVDDDTAQKQVVSTDGTASITEPEWLKFENKYSIDELTAVFTAYKSINGSTDLSVYKDANPEFSFSLYEAKNEKGRWVTVGEVIDTQTVNLDTHSVTFSGEKLTEDASGKNKLKFGADDLKDPNFDDYLDKIDKYFIIQEDELTDGTSGKNFSAGTRRILVKLHLYKKSGRLQLDPSYAILEGDTSNPDADAFGTDDAHHTIDNTYMGSIALGLEGSVALESKIRDMADQSFTVKVTNVTDEKDPQKLAEYTVGGDDGSAGKTKVGYTSPDDVLNYDQDDVGKTYTYTVTQTKMTKGTEYERDGEEFTDASGYTADAGTYKVTVTIKVTSEGSLKADYTVTDEEGTEKSGTFVSTDKDKKIKELDFVNQYAAKGKIILLENTTFRAEKGTDTTVSQWLNKLDPNGQTGFDYRVYAAEKDEAESSTIDLTGKTVLVSHRDIAGDYEVQPSDSSTKDAKLQKLTADAGLYQLDEKQVSKDYTDEKSQLGSYYYYVEQVVPAGAEDDVLNGLTYGDDGTTDPRIHAYFVKATLTDDEDSVDGTLKVSYAKKEVEQGATVSLLAPLLNLLGVDGFTETDDRNLLTFVNTYRASGTALLTGVKKLNKRNMTAGEFTFQLQQTSANMETGSAASELGQTGPTGAVPILTVTNPAASAGQESEVFEWKQKDTDDYTDRYTAVGTYTYSATEVTADLPEGVTADTAADTLTVTVKDSHDGIMTAEVEAANSTDGSAFFENTYGATGSLTISGGKTINGGSVDGYTHNQFIFTLYSADAGGSVTQKVVTTANPDGTATSDGMTGMFEFTLDYTEEDFNTATGDYTSTVTRTYRLKETGKVTPDDDYDMFEKYYDIEVKLTDNGDKTIDAWISKITPGTKSEGPETSVPYQNTDESQKNALASLTFDNIYATKATLTLGGKKIPSGFTLTADTDSAADQRFRYDHFAFLLYNCDENGDVKAGEKPIDMVQLTDSAEFSFEQLTFRYGEGTDGKRIDDTGSHYYKIVEVRTEGTYETAKDSNRHMPGSYTPEKLENYTPVSDMLYAETGYVVKVDVEYDEDHPGGALYATPSMIRPAGKDKVEFTNTYPTGTIEIPVVSAYEAKPGTDTSYTDSKVTYSYTMTPVDERGNALTDKPPVGIKADKKDLTNETYSTSDPVGDDNINAVSCNAKFAEQTVHNTDVHYYKIEQIENGSNPGMTFDKGYYLVKVTTEENPADAAQLTSSISEVTYYGADGTVRKQETGDPIRFTNVYAAEPAGFSVQVGKTTDKRSMKEGEFSFELSWMEDGKTQTLTASNGAAKLSETGAVVFNGIEYAKTGEHIYTLREKNEKQISGITDDTSVYTITVQVADGHEGKLKGSITSIKKNGGNELLTSSIAIAGKDAEGRDTVTDLTDHITFKNQYAAEGAFVTLLGTKTINGRNAGSFLNNQFTFDLFPAKYENGVYTATGAAVDTAKSDAADGSFELKAEFTQDDLFTTDGAGASVWNRTLDYHFIIQERAEDHDQHGYDSNTASIGVTVTLTDNMDGTLKAEITEMKVQPEDGQASVKEYNGSSGSFGFDNTYHAEGELTIPGLKTMEGADLSTMKDGVFTFEIVDAAGKVVSTAQNGVDGKFTFTLPCDGSMIGGETVFKIREVNDQKPGIKYDETVYQFVVTAEDKGDGNMEVTGTLYRSGAVADTAEFVNARRSSHKKHDDEEEPSVPAASTPNGVSGPKTGDVAGVLEYTLLMFLSSGGIFGATRKKKRHGKKKEDSEE